MQNLTRILSRYPMACLMAAVFMAACSDDRDRHDHPGLTTGEALFEFHCAACHGDDGTGKLVDRTPANILTTKNEQGIVDYIVNNTGRGRKMPVFATMPGTEARKIAAYLIALQIRYDNLAENKKKSRELMIDPEHMQRVQK